ncbi:hypothetical protein [Natrinema sp. 1APR25-10V2]|uniref:DUF7093 family protein n=1 Tax=Natrinema sp. 1APR25-10V2 TaxID=2951081 RepID=UPI0028741FC9|nr:hypothetical protein [Natrinema sp. 1APR25-10V2]MDS0476593.1 hypothetical protein [Natrinema sp. 1APR25-10V2]
MVLRCSLLGHDFGESDVEREREERGSEVVVTVQEYEECSRCGERNVISENTEVTSLSAETDADTLSDDPDEELIEDTPESDAAAAETGTDAEFIDADAAADADDAATGDVGTSEAAPSAGSAPDDGADDIEVPTDENGDPVTDDGEILEDDGPEPDRDRDRDHGEWPDSDDVGPPVGAESEPAAWPDDESDTETAVADDPDEIDPEEIDDDAVLLENDAPADGLGGASVTDDAADADARSVTTEAPEANTVGADRNGASDSGIGIERAQSAPAPAESSGSSTDDVPTEFYCPRCEYVAAGDRSSLRAGDICPDCRKGYLSEREQQ